MARSLRRSRLGVEVRATRRQDPGAGPRREPPRRDQRRSGQALAAPDSDLSLALEGGRPARGRLGRQGYFSHDSADGSDFGGRIARYYQAAGFRHWSVGENLLWSAQNLAARDALRIWMNSRHHRANLLRPGWRQIGISGRWFADAPGVFGHRGVWIVATDFGTRY